MRTPVYISTPNIPTRSRRMIRAAWNEARRLRRGGDTVDIIGGKVLVNGHELRNVIAVETSRPVWATLSTPMGMYCDPVQEVTLKLLVDRGQITYGHAEY